MGFFDKIGGWFGRVVDRVQELRDRIRPVVEDSAKLAEVSAGALVDAGDKVAAWEPSDIAWLTGPVAQAVVSAQQSALITAAVGAERLEAVRLALKGANHALHYADDVFDSRWEKAKPYIEQLIVRLKDRRLFGFKPSEAG